MEMKKFKDLELKFYELRKKSEKGEIDSSTINKELKKLMVMDSNGTYWIIGGNSGKWYKYDGKNWKEDNPYKSEDTAKIQMDNDNTSKIINNKGDFEKTINTSSSELINKSDQSTYDNKLICKSCKSKIRSFELYCHICGTNQKETPKINNSPEPQNNIPELLISSINLVSLIFFFGGIGIIIGVVLGATIGIFKDIPVYIDLPQMLTNLRSNILGGIIFAILGGIAGFVAFSIKAIFIGSLYNMISYFFGGIRFRTKK